VLRTGNLTLATTAYQYTASVPTKDLPLINAAAYTYAFLQNVATAEDQEQQLDLFYDYRNNKGIYPKFHEYFQESQVPLPAVLGKGDPAFIPPGAEAFRKDLPNAVIRFVDGGHSALETKVGEIAGEMLRFWKGIKYWKKDLMILKNFIVAE